MVTAYLGMHIKGLFNILYIYLIKLQQLERLRSEIPPTASWLPTVVIHIRTQVKTRQSYKFEKIAKNKNFENLPETLHAAHLLKLLNKMCKYEMDPTRTVGAIERTRDAGRTEGQTDGRTDGVKPIYSPTTSLCGGYNKSNFSFNLEVWKQIMATAGATILYFSKCLCNTLLTHWGWDKMAAILQTFSNAFPWMKTFKFQLKFHWSLFVPKGPINNIPALVQIMAWWWPGDKALSEQMMVEY